MFWTLWYRPDRMLKRARLQLDTLLVYIHRNYMNTAGCETQDFSIALTKIHYYFFLVTLGLVTSTHGIQRLLRQVTPISMC